MKKSLLILPLILCGCVVPPPATINNPECLESEWEIQQVLDDGFLLRECENNPYIGRTCYGISAFFETNTKKKSWKDWGEGMVLPANSANNDCLARDGTYKYTTTMGIERTVMKLKGIENNIPNPEYKEWKAEQDKKQKE
ncbi:MAG TPA: hypothetical protein PKJ33_03015 [Alphaproteobacteria bacterium]|nr:hypothetical protein [Alphaproteobacteria bacterium]